MQTENTTSRQVRRRAALIAAKRADRPGPNRAALFPDTAKPDRMNSHVLWTVMRGRTEVYMHATKGLRTRFLGGAA